MQTASPVHALAPFMTPRGVAIVGSFREGWFSGRVLVRDLLNAPSVTSVYPVNPKVREVLGVRTYPRVADIDGSPDLAVIIRAAHAVPSILEECGQKGVRAVVVVSDGFAEIGAEGKRLQSEILAIARRYGMRLIGPNTLGIVNASNGVSTVPYGRAYDEVPKGGLSIVCQSGLLGPQAIELADLQIGISKILDLGNMCDVDETECLDYLGEDPDTRIIAMYVETIRRGRVFLETARRVTRKKPVLCLKSGRSEAGAEAMTSHTGSLAGADAVYDGVFRQAGVLRIEEFREILTLSKAFLHQPLPKGNRLGVASISGAGGVMALDYAEREGLEAARLSEDSSRRLNALYPSLGKNPVDFGPAASLLGDFGLLYRETLRVFLEDPGVDALFVTLYSTPVNTSSFYEDLFAGLGDVLTKPVVAWIYGSMQSDLLELTSVLESKGIPCYMEMTTAVRALGFMARYSARIRE